MLGLALNKLTGMHRKLLVRQREERQEEQAEA